jgi:hypothetical protein
MGREEPGDSHPIIKGGGHGQSQPGAGGLGCSGQPTYEFPNFPTSSPPQDEMRKWVKTMYTSENTSHREPSYHKETKGGGYHFKPTSEI